MIFIPIFITLKLENFLKNLIYFTTGGVLIFIVKFIKKIFNDLYSHNCRNLKRKIFKKNTFFNKKIKFYFSYDFNFLVFSKHIWSDHNRQLV